MAADSDTRHTSYALGIAVGLFLMLGGLNYYLERKRGADRATCIMHQRNIQQAIRGYQGINGLPEGAPLDWSYIRHGFGPGEDHYSCPCGGAYKLSPTVLPLGSLHAPCTKEGHQPLGISDW